MINLMESRYIHLQQALMGYVQTGIPLIEYDGSKLLPAYPLDDLGIYILIPKIAYYLNISLVHAINGFFYGILGLSLCVGIIGFCKYYTTMIQRLIAIIGLILLSYISAKIGDVYIVFSASAMALVPWALYVIHAHSGSIYNYVYFLVAGVFIGMIHYIRAYSGVGIGLYIVSLLLLKKHAYVWQQKVLFLLCLLIGVLIPVGYFTHVYNQYLIDAKAYAPQYPIGSKNHVLWHNVYIGFGFLQFLNKENICYNDTCAEQKVLSINPSVTTKNNSVEYEKILKEEVFRLIRQHKLFVMYTFFAKIGVLLFLFLKFANIGILATIVYPQHFFVYIPYIVACLINGLFPIITIPVPEFALGFIAFAALFGITSINYALEQYDLRKRAIPVALNT